MPPLPHGQYALRPYRAEDYHEVLEIFRSNTPQFFAVSELEDFTAFMRAPESEMLVATSADGAVLGFGAAYRRSASEGGLAWGMVHRRWHRHGIGRALLDARITRLWTLNLTQIRVHTSQHSARFFARARFEQVAVTPDGFAHGIDAVTMLLKRPATLGPHDDHAGTGG